MFFRRKKHEIEGDTLEQLLETAGLADRLEALSEEELPAIWLKTEPSNDAAVPPGGSKFGGCPDLPEDFQWPMNEGRPLQFLAQVQLADAIGIPGAEALPDSGHLAFFYDPDQPWGFSPEHAAGSRVVHVDTPIAARRQTPGPPLPVCRLTLAPKTTIPDGMSMEAEELVLSNAEMDDYVDMAEVYAQRFPGPEHQMLGHPVLVQGDMRLEVALVSSGHDCGDGTVFQSEAAAEHIADASAWRLLLQLDSDDAAGMMWGDVGLLYFWIHEDDLAAADFSAVRVILQCS